MCYSCKHNKQKTRNGNWIAKIGTVHARIYRLIKIISVWEKLLFILFTLICIGMPEAQRRLQSHLTHFKPVAFHCCGKQTVFQSELSVCKKHVDFRACMLVYLYPFCIKLVAGSIIVETGVSVV